MMLRAETDAGGAETVPPPFPEVRDVPRAHTRDWEGKALRPEQAPREAEGQGAQEPPDWAADGDGYEWHGDSSGATGPGGARVRLPFEYSNVYYR